MSTYASNKLWQTVYGPYRLRSFNDVTGGFTMVPNTRYSGPHANPMSNYVGVPFTSDAAEWNAIKSGSVDFGYVPAQDVPQIPALNNLGYNYFGLPDFGDYFADYNFKDKTGHFSSIVAQLYFRQAMQHLEDQAGQIKAFFGGDADPAYGPIPVYPRSPFLPSNAATNPYPFSVRDAISLLRAHGWNVTPNGTYATQFGFLNTGGAGQLGDYSNPRADALINQSVSGRNPAAVKNEASFFTAQLPVLWQPVPDYVWAWKSKISATTPTAIENLTQYDDTPQFWYLTK